VILPPGEDPDSLVHRLGGEALRAAMAQSLSMIDFLWRQSITGVPLDTPERRAAAERGLMARLGTIADREVRTHYRRELGQRLRDLWRTAGRSDRPRTPLPFVPSPQLATSAARASRLAEQSLLEPFLLTPGLLHELEEELAGLHFADGELDRLRCEILAWYATEPALDGAELRTHLHRHGFEPLVEHILRLRISARVVSRLGDEDDVHGAWRSAAARHSRSVARGAHLEAPEAGAIEEQQADLIARIGTLNRQLEGDRGRAGPGRRSDDGSS
jgi:DNA primase